MLRRVLRHVRDTFAAGAAERRFRLLESEMRELMAEVDHTLNKWAIRAATDARRKTRASAKALDVGVADLPDHMPTGPDARAAWKANVRRQLQAGRTRRGSAEPVIEAAEPEPEETTE